MTKVTDILGVEHDISCIACAIQSGEVTLPVERIAESEHFVAEQDFEYPIEGFVIIASKRHIHSVAEFTEEEMSDFISFLVKCRRAMRDVPGVEEVTLVQEETSNSSHFHMWLFPWLEWMNVSERKIDVITEVMKKAKQERTYTDNIEHVKKASAVLRERLKSK